MTSPNIVRPDGLTQVLIKSYFEGRYDGYLVFPKASLSEIFDRPIKRYLEMRGHDIITGVGIEDISIQNRQVAGFKTTKDSQLKKADLYISALPFWNLKKVVDLEQTQLKSLNQMEGSPIVSINLFYDQPIMNEDFIGSAATRTHWFFEKNHTHHNITKITGVISGAYDLLEKSKQDILEFAKNDIKKLYPTAHKASLVHATVNIERQATLSSRKGINRLRPPQKNLSNFYILGDWTRTGLPATIESAITSAKLMQQDLAPPQ